MLLITITALPLRGRIRPEKKCPPIHATQVQRHFTLSFCASLYFVCVLSVMHALGKRNSRLCKAQVYCAARLLSLQIVEDGDKFTHPPLPMGNFILKPGTFDATVEIKGTEAKDKQVHRFRLPDRRESSSSQIKGGRRM